MARQEIVSLVDDVDGGPADETVEFAVDGKPYEIDLSATNAAKLRDGLAPFVAHARRAGGTRSGGRRSGSTRARSADRDRNATIREWAQQKGMKVAERGRLATEVVEAYEREHSDVRHGTGTATVVLAAG